MRILNVDDNENNLYMIEALFNRKDYYVFSAHNGAEALDALENESFDLIISDILMPEVDGWQLCYEVRINEKWKHIPFIFYTATYTSKKDEEFAINLGASHFIIKPEDPEIFINLINNLAKDSGNAGLKAPKLEYDDELKFIKVHNDRLVNKLSGKVNQLEKANLDLQKAIAEKSREISERVQAEKSLLKSEKLYHTLFEKMLNGFSYCKMIFEDDKPSDFMYITVNKAFEKQTGLKDVTGKKASEVIPGIQKSDPGLIKRYERVAITGIPEAFEIYVESLKMWFSISVYSPVRDHFVAVFDVITERKLGEEALRLSEERLRYAAEAASFGTYSYDFVTGKVYYSPEHLALYGLPPDATIELNADLSAKALHPEDKTAFLAAMAEANKSGEKNSGILDIEFRIIHADGRIRWLRARGRTAFNKSGCPERADGFVQEITERKYSEEALRESEERFRLIFENSLDALFFSAPDGTIFSVNPAGCRMFGRSEKEICRIGRNGIIDASDPGLVKSLVSREKNRYFKGELFGIKADGKKFPVEVTSIIFTNQKNEKRTSTIMRDITERKKTEERINKLNRTYAVLSEINKAIVRIKDQQELFDSTCRIAVETGGFRFCWIGVIDIERDRVTPAAKYGFSEDFLDVIKISLSADKQEGKGPTSIAFREKKYNICNDIENDERMIPWREEAIKRGYCSSAAFPLTKSGNIYGMIIFYSSEKGFFDEEETKLLEELSSDISFCIETMEHEKQKQSIEEDRDRLFNYSIDMMSVGGFDGFYKQLNPAWEKTLGWTNEELMAKPFIEFIHPEDIEFSLKTIEELKTGKKIKTDFVYRHMCKNGNYKWLSWNLVTIIKENLIFIVARDITAAIQNENEKKKLEAQLVQAQKLESLGTMAGGIAHDFNNILNIIMGYSSLLKMPDIEESEIIYNADVILDASRRGAGLVKQLLTFARKSESMFQALQVNDTIIELIKMLKETFPKSVAIDYELREDLPLIIADSTQMHQVFLNLCVNARDAMPDGGSITISTNRADGSAVKSNNPEAENTDYLEIKVQDSGTGMDEATKQKIFEPFFTTKGTGKGTGLGLALVYGIVKSHGGFVNVTSETGKGTCFFIYLPVTEHAPEIQETSVKADDDLPRGSGTILLIEDEKISSELLTTILVLRGYKVITAYDGLQGISAYRDHKEEINLIISDLGLPKLGGEEVYKQIKKIDPGVKIILISGFIDPEVKARLLDAGIHDILQKPYMPARILHVIKKTLEGK